jgi:hypothetical protein
MRPIHRGQYREKGSATVLIYAVLIVVVVLAFAGLSAGLNQPLIEVFRWAIAALPGAN